MKKIITVFLTLIVAFSLSITVFAESTTENTVSGIWQLNANLSLYSSVSSSTVGSRTVKFDDDVNFTLYAQESTATGYSSTGIYNCSNIYLSTVYQSSSPRNYYSQFRFYWVDNSKNVNIASHNTYVSSSNQQNFMYTTIFTRCILDFGSEPQTVSSSFVTWLNANATRLTSLEKVPDADDGSGDEETTPSIEYVYLKENRPMFETPLSDYSVSEGILLLIFVVTVLNNVFKSHIKG